MSFQSLLQNEANKRFSDIFFLEFNVKILYVCVQTDLQAACSILIIRLVQPAEFTEFEAN